MNTNSKEFSKKNMKIYDNLNSYVDDYTSFSDLGINII